LMSRDGFKAKAQVQHARRTAAAMVALLSTHRQLYSSRTDF
jgi:hypothetical protein